MKKSRNRLLPAVATLIAGSALSATAAEHSLVPADLFSTDDPNLEVTIWAASPTIKNPINMDTDQYGRIWVSEGVNYRRHYDRQPEGDRVVVLEDTNGDGTADKSWTFVQEPALRAPMGIAVMGNKVVVSMAPDIIVYTDVNGDAKFDPKVDKREVLITGFKGHIHDHTVHSVTAGPDGQWYFNAGNCGAIISDKSGKTFRIGSAYEPKFMRDIPVEPAFNPTEIAGQKSDDGHVYIGGFAARINPDGDNLHIIGHNFRNSYEQIVTSLGDVFQNDNDDPPACRTAFLMEHGNAGFCSFDGQRRWQADRRPGQSTQVSEWRQEDPGTLPAGDVYGGGSPTGITFVESGPFKGLLLSCEPGRNVVFGYRPVADGAGYKLERFNFFTSNQSGDFAGGDFNGGNNGVSGELPTLFRPSDVTVGTDGAIYVADFFDPRVGGHTDLDDSVSGAIYRIAPKGFKGKKPSYDLSTIEGALAALKSPSVNVRGTALQALKSHGADAIEPAAQLLKDKNPYIKARAIWLLSQLGKDGMKKVRPLLKSKNDDLRLVAFRATRRTIESRPRNQEKALANLANRFSEDSSAAIRREAALSLRDVPFEQAQEPLVKLAQKYDGQDRWMLEAIGTGATGKEAELYNALVAAMNPAAPAKWEANFATLAWRLHPEESADGFRARALNANLNADQRKAAVTALAYIGSKLAVTGILDVAQKADGPAKADAIWWLINRKGDAWKDYSLDSELKSRGIYNPDEVELMASSMPDPILKEKPVVAEVLKLKGDAARGPELISRCTMCHRIDGIGNDVGPDLTAFGKAQTSEVIAQAIIDPSADIAHGFEAQVIQTKDGQTIEGLVLTDGNPVVMSSAGGITQMVPRNRIASKKRLDRSLMWTPNVLGLTNQDVADLIAYLKSL